MSQDPKPTNSIDLAAARAKLEREGGKQLWRSLEQLSDTPESRKFLENEFPSIPARKVDASDGVNRRDVLKLMAASAAMAGLGACTKLPTEKIVPYVRPPEEIIPGRPLFYATSIPQSGVAAGVLVESHMGRPTKMEGNSEHPGSLGGTDAFTQASILNMYDPDRSQVVLNEGRVSTWEDFAQGMPLKSAGIRLLTKTLTSPTLGVQIHELLTRFPEAKWHQYEPCGCDSSREGARLAFGKVVDSVYHFDQADVVVALDADFLVNGPGHARYAREFTSRRDLAAGPDSKLNRLYVVESMATSTGVVADHRLPLRSSDVEVFARQLAAAAGVAVPQSANASVKIPAGWVEAVARDLTAHRGSSLVVVGENQPPFVHALAHALNASLGNVGKTVTYIESIEVNPVNQLASLEDLVNDLNAGKVELLVVLGGNPVYDAPADLNFATALQKATTRVHSGLYNDETAELCHWHVPAAHFLESWSDARAYDGTASILQPLIQPLYDAHTPHQIIGLFTGDAGKSDHDLVHDYWQSQRPEKGRAFEVFWETSLHDGLLAGTAFPAISMALRPDWASQAGAESASGADASAMEIVFRPDPTVGDGEYSNNSWLQECPKPVTRITWDNAAMISPTTAQLKGLTTGDYIKLHLNERYMEAGVFVVPGHADNSVTMHLGYGRRRAGSIGTGPGFDGYLLRHAATPWIARGLRIEKTDKKYYFASMQQQNTIDVEGHAEEEESTNAFARDLVRIATMDEFRKNPAFAQLPEEVEEKDLTIYPGFKYDGYSWGMSIDLNRCIGCNACVVACQSENNIAVVGKEQVMRGRIMQWIRIDTYFRGDLDNPETYYEPMPCMQCENAPCEYVCPVGATTHSPEGLNDMTYNRCVGTRYCSNNCPYKVRRFNFLLFSDYTTPSLYGVRNPNVTVRSRGVMEKCTYCVQRINAAKIKSEEENRTVHDGEIVTACQQACPAEAIIFGDINDKSSRVSKLKAQKRDYGLLEELNTRPRTTYLARVKNPNPEMHS
ncbi:MAG: TAT-variant-translocated molybdopterin oxidoreductase [Candidatus Acidiferrales bacterium]